MDDVPVRALLPLLGIGALTLCLSFCFCCYLWWLRRQDRHEVGYKQIEFRRKKKMPFGVDTSCAVCLDEYSVGDKVAVCRCKHAFHSKCLQQWLNHSNTCPMCKATVQTEPGENTSLVHNLSTDSV